jgi:hypothetical protein
MIIKVVHIFPSFNLIDAEYYYRHFRGSYLILCNVVHTQPKIVTLSIDSLLEVKLQNLLETLQERLLIRCVFAHIVFSCRYIHLAGRRHHGRANYCIQMKL